MYILVAVGIIVLLTGLLVESPAFRQKSDEVVVREPGKRLLGPPQPIWTTGREHLPFALLSQAAYERKPKIENPDRGGCVNPDAILHTMHWSRWTDFPNADLQESFAKVHLRVEVWSNVDERAVAVTFGGTMVGNLQDWKANFRWFLPHHNDQYTTVVKTFAVAFVSAFTSFWRPLSKRNMVLTKWNGSLGTLTIRLGESAWGHCCTKDQLLSILSTQNFWSA